MSDQKTKQYTKHSSNYIKTTPHQTLNDGSTIFERDWVTIGSQLSFGPNKTPYFNDGNFIFTTSILPTYQKKPKLGNEVGVYTYEDLTNDDTYVETDEVVINCCDMRSYAYYGSCVELLRTSVENIIQTFPPSISVDTSTEVKIEGKTLGYKVLNPFLVDLIGVYSNNDTIDELRILEKSYKHFVLKLPKDNEDGKNEFIAKDIKTYTTKPNLVKNTNLYDCKNEFFHNDGNPVVTIKVNEVENVSDVEKKSDAEINGYLIDGEISFYSDKNFVITPKKEVIKEYFKHLSGFEKVLLNQHSTPKYTNDFITPLESSNGYNFFKRRYTWPSYDGNIDIQSNSYTSYLNGLMNIAQTFDELSSNVIWNKLTHESIKNYDWDKSHNDEYLNGANPVPNEERMHKVINIIGATFDKIKHRIDTVKHKNYISYDSSYIAPTSTILERLKMQGWEIYPILLNAKKDNGTTQNGTKEKSVAFDLQRLENEMFKRFLLSSKRILQTKGTANAVKMVFGFFGYGDDEFTIKEEYYTTNPKKYPEEEEHSTNQGENPEKKKPDVFAINRGKYIQYDRFEPLAGIPVGTISVYEEVEKNNKITLKENTYLVPYFKKGKKYDGNIYFQSKGGWCYNKNSETYAETIPYLHTASTIEDLLQTNPNMVNKGDVYYVVNISDISTYNDKGSLDEHFFVLDDDFNPNLFESWIQFGIDKDSFDKAKPASDKIIKNAITKAKYLDSIVPTNKGNNPHCGFGFYDNGETYRQYLEKPFKYAIEKNLLSTEDKEKAENFGFIITKNFTSTNLPYKVVNVDKQKVDNTTTYYLNSKMVTITNNINNEYYIEYFHSTILPYLLQVIPSTTILILEDYQYVKTKTEK